jgi:hypothetical protein
MDSLSPLMAYIGPQEDSKGTSFGAFEVSGLAEIETEHGLDSNEYRFAIESLRSALNIVRPLLVLHPFILIECTRSHCQPQDWPSSSLLLPATHLTTRNARSTQTNPHKHPYQATNLPSHLKNPSSRSRHAIEQKTTANPPLTPAQGMVHVQTQPAPSRVSHIRVLFALVRPPSIRGVRPFGSERHARRWMSVCSLVCLLGRHWC